MLGREGKRYLSGILLLMLIAGGVICYQAAAAPIAVTGPTVITAPGTYILTRDIISNNTSRCIEIRAPNVTFDGRGHQICGSGMAGSSGISIAGSLSSGPVTIRGVKVMNWDQGITVTTSRAIIERCTATENNQGFTLVYATGTSITGCTAANNTRMGFDLHDSARVVMTGNTLSGNTGGIGLLTSPGATITANNIRNNTWGVVAESSDRPVIRNNLFMMNGDAIVLSHSTGAIIGGNRIIPR